MRVIPVVVATLLIGSAVAQAQDDPVKAACDAAAASLAESKPKDAVAKLEPFLKNPALAGSAQRERLYYYLGCAAFAVDHDTLAGRALSSLAPFEHPIYAAHARYLLGRIHHRAGESTEAAMHYDAVPAAHEKQVAAAKQLLQNPQALKDAPAEKARLEALVKGPPPDFVTESFFHSGVLLYEQKSFPEALQKFALFLQKEKRPIWAEEARLRAGMCHARLGQNAEALKMLQPVQDHAKLARPARWWMARAILAMPDGKPADAAEHLKKAAAAPEADPGPATADILLLQGEALERAGKPAEAVEVYKQLLASGAKAEEALARLASAHAAAKQYKEAEETAAKFEKQYPSSPFLADVVLRRADVAFADGQANPQQGQPRLAEALKLYDRVLAGASGATANSAHYKAALAQYRLGKTAEALAHLRAIADPDRTGELAGAYYLHAECILRTVSPAEDAVDALTAVQLLKDLQEAAGQLQKFVPQAGDKAPDALMKLAQALRQSAVLLVDPQEKVQAANQAREIYEGFRAQFPNHPLRPVAEYERANCFALAGDVQSAIQKLERFRAEPLAAAPVAPLANLRQAQLYRSIQQPQQAVAILTDCRNRHEAALLKDPGRAAWVPLLRYHHAAALKEVKQVAEAAQILEGIVKDFGGSEWAEPSRRLLKEVKP